VLNNGGVRRNTDSGYQPVITVIPEGTGAIVRAATADRLHVIISPSPIFSFIGDVDTFTFFGSNTGSQNAGGTGGTTGGAAGGAAGGGGGGTQALQGAGGGLF
jgi:hypothetical protein